MSQPSSDPHPAPLSSTTPPDVIHHHPTHTNPTPKFNIFLNLHKFGRHTPPHPSRPTPPAPPFPPIPLFGAQDDGATHDCRILLSSWQKGISQSRYY